MAAGQFPCLEDEGSEKSFPQIVGLTDGGGASEGMHPRLHVPRRRSAPKAAATADVSHLVEQGLVQSLGVFIDTLVICSTTAFVILFDRSCTSRTREAREEAVAATAFVWAHASWDNAEGSISGHSEHGRRVCDGGYALARPTQYLKMWRTSKANRRLAASGRGWLYSRCLYDLRCGSVF